MTDRELFFLWEVFRVVNTDQVHPLCIARGSCPWFEAFLEDMGYKIPYDYARTIVRLGRGL